MCLLSCRFQLEVGEREELMEILMMKVFLVDQVHIGRDRSGTTKSVG